MARFSVITQSSPQELTDEKGAGVFLKVPALLDKMVKAGWVKPIVQRGKLKLYRLTHLERCVDRLEAGEFPE